MSIWLCPNKKCNPLMPFFGNVRLKRKRVYDYTTGYCHKCKSHIDIEIMTDGKHKHMKGKDVRCLKCNVELKPSYEYYEYCLKCGWPDGDEE